VTLRSDPAHKIVNPVLYRQDEVRACWQLATAPVLWVEAADSDALKRVGLDTAAHAERRAAFRALRYVTVPGSGHMLHHDQPQAVARLLDEFLLAR
jgi:pimeloyl-ACP methyl ester carboxylesterase